MSENPFQTAAAGSVIVFDFVRQAWFPASESEPLTPERPALARLKRAANYEPHIGLRSANIDFDIFRNYVDEPTPAPVPADA